MSLEVRLCHGTPSAMAQVMCMMMTQAQKILKADRCTLLLHDSKTNTLWSRPEAAAGRGCTDRVSTFSGIYMPRADC